jgi:hypothetical protein
MTIKEKVFVKVKRRTGYLKPQFQPDLVYARTFRITMQLGFMGFLCHYLLVPSNANICVCVSTVAAQEPLV